MVFLMFLAVPVQLTDWLLKTRRVHRIWTILKVFKIVTVGLTSDPLLSSSQMFGANRDRTSETWSKIWLFQSWRQQFGTVKHLLTYGLMRLSLALGNQLFYRDRPVVSVNRDGSFVHINACRTQLWAAASVLTVSRTSNVTHTHTHTHTS